VTFTWATSSPLVFSTALKLSLLPTLSMYLFVSTIPDIGVGAASVLGLIAASHTPAPRPVPGPSPSSPVPVGGRA